ncbi:MAG: DNA-binding protein [Anaerolineae bacterium]|jgi:predicted nucleic acid-binding protein
MARTDPAPAVVCDAGPLIHLDELGCLDLLADFSSVLVPEPVWREVAQHRANALAQTGVSLTRVKVALPDDTGFQVLVQALSLDVGEQAALSLMRLYPNAILLTDDAAARLAADQLSVEVHGTIGVLLRSIRRGQRTAEEALSLLQQLPQRSTLHIRSDLLLAVIGQVRQEFDLSQ